MLEVQFQAYLTLHCMKLSSHLHRLVALPMENEPWVLTGWKNVGPKRDGVTRGWRRLYNEEVHNLYYSPSVIRIIKSRRMRWAGHVARMGEKRNVYRLLLGKPEGKRPLGRPRRRWMDNIKIDLLEIGLNVVGWIGLAQFRYRWRALVNSVMNLRVPKKCWELPSGCTTCGLSSGTQLHRVS
jgi:hypothetical protein